MERPHGDARLRLESTRDPIGRVLAGIGLAISRQPLPGSPIPVRATGGIVDLLDGAALYRRYRISVGREAVIVISGWFLQTVPDALASFQNSFAGFTELVRRTGRPAVPGVRLFP